jgi:hypothetical protein
VSETDFELLAASLRADAGDLRTFVEALAAKLEGAFPDRVRVERAGGFLGGRKRVRAITLRLGDDEYRLETDDGPAQCRRRVLVRGIALKNEELTLDEWIDAISGALVAEARDSERSRAALARLLGTT